MGNMWGGGNLEHGELLPLLLYGERRVRVEDDRGAGGLGRQLPFLRHPGRLGSWWWWW